MKIWLVTSGEPVPTDEKNVRLLRTGIFASFLGSKGHDVTWWTADFNHSAKRHRRQPSPFELVNGARISFVPSPGYYRNISLSRIRDHFVLGRNFLRAAHGAPKPDVIVTSLPPLELCSAAVRYGRRMNVPTIVDVRDLWPDVFVEAFPSRIRSIAPLALRPYRSLGIYSCQRATAISAPTRQYLEWGLRLGGRDRGPLDMVIPFGYPTQPPSLSDIQAATRMWDAQSIMEKGRALRICFLGTIGHQFDFQTVIDAARLLHERKRAVEFVLCGNGEREDHWKAEAADLPNVVFPGFIDSPSIWVLMRRSHVGLAPYRAVGNFLKNIPNKPIEYMSAGLPVLAGLTGAIEEMLRHHKCGVFYSNGSPESLATAVMKLEDDRDLLQQLSANSRKAFDDYYSAEKVYGDFAAGLQEVVRSSSSVKLSSSNAMLERTGTSRES